MKKEHSVLLACPLFAGIDSTELDAMLACLRAIPRQYAREAAIFLHGMPATSVGVVLSGAVDVVQADFWGNQTLLARLGPSDLFGEAFACAGVPALPVSVLAAEPTDALLLDYPRVLSTCDNSCRFHTQLIANMLRVLAMKNIALTQKVEHVTRRTTQEKVLSYLSMASAQAGDTTFEIPLNRQALADYLAVDRSALSAVLSRMRRSGLLRFEGNRFTLLAPQE